MKDLGGSTVIEIVGEAGEYLPTRQTLLCRLQHWDDQESWREFFELYWKLIYTTARKAGLTDAEAQDVVQETIITVSKQMPRFRYDPTLGSFKAWLMRITGCRIIDQLRKRLPQKHAAAGRGAPDADTATVERIADPHGFDPCALWDEEWERNLMDVAIERVKQKVDARQYQIFDLYVFKHWTVRQLVDTLKVSPAMVYLAKHRISKLIRDQVKRLQMHLN